MFKNFYYTPLQSAIFNNYVEIVKILLSIPKIDTEDNEISYLSNQFNAVYF